MRNIVEDRLEEYYNKELGPERKEKQRVRHGVSEIRASPYVRDICFSVNEAQWILDQIKGLMSLVESLEMKSLKAVIEDELGER